MDEQTRSEGFLITPMNQHFELKPGEVFEGSIKVANPAGSSNNFKYVVSVAPYGVIGEDYEADFVTNSVWNQIANWITLKNNKGELEPNGVEYIDFTITVPENAPAGAQSATIVVTRDTDENQNTGMLMENVFEMVSIIYANIAGEIRHEGSILSNDVPFFSDSPAVAVGVMFDNNGNTFEEATIEISAKNVISGEIILPTDVNNGVYTDTVVPETRRYVRRNVSDLPFLGVIQIEQKVYYNGDTSIVSKNVIICPIWFMVLIGITIVLFVAAITKMIKLHKKKKVVVL